MIKHHIFKNVLIGSFIIIGYYSSISPAQAQNKYLGGRFGLSVTGSGSTSLGLQFGPTFELGLQNNLAYGAEFNINTQAGTPIELANSIRYYLATEGIKAKPYLDGGLGLWFVSGGPYFGLRFGGGALFNFSPNLTIPADIQVGPIFSSGSTVFYMAITSGIRYSLP